jgi:hypothetical protein
VSPRRIRRERAPAPPETIEEIESWPDGDWVVRPVPGQSSAKTYRCPGCDQEIPPGRPHLVAWPAQAQPFGMTGFGVGRQGVGERRHWHRPCWERRMQRRPSGSGHRPGRRV